MRVTRDDREPLPFAVTRAGGAYRQIDRLPVVVMLYNLRSVYNVGAFFRTADGARVRELLLAGITATPPHRGVAKTALGAEKTVPWRRIEHVEDTLRDLSTAGYQVAAIETTTRAVDLFDWRPAFPVCIIFGHEVDGLPACILERCDLHVRIPTLGAKQSLNVATAGGIVTYELLRHYREQVARAARGVGTASLTPDAAALTRY